MIIKKYLTIKNRCLCKKIFCVFDGNRLFNQTNLCYCLFARGILSFISKMCGMTSSLRENECVRFHCQSEGGSCLAGCTGPERQSRSGNITIDTDEQVGILCKGAFFPESTHPMNVMGKAYS